VFFGTFEVSVAKNPGIYNWSSVGRVENPKLREEILKIWNENPKFRVENTKFQKWQREVSGKTQHIETSVIFFFRSATEAKTRNF
jgi:hypothetical protein